MSLARELYEDFRSKIFEVLDASIVNEMTPAELAKQIENAVHTLSRNYPTPIPSITRIELAKSLVDEFT